MKRTVSLLATLCLMQGAHAQTITSAVPGFISYQGRALDANGVAIGTSGGALAPVNRTVTFRVWDHPSNVLEAHLIYSEQQTVTISGGEFSVLIGQGTATTGTTFGYSESSRGIPTVKIGDLGVFGGATRYLGVTIEDGTAAVDNEISPRQQLVSSAYSFRSKYAEQLGANGLAALTALDSGNVGIGNTNPPARFTVTGANTGTSSANPQLLVTDSADPTKRLRIGVDSNGTGSAGTSTGFIQSFREGTGVQNLLLNPNGGNVGIGNTNPAVALSVAGAITATGAITGGSISTAGAITTTGAITATGAITGGSFSTAGVITATGAITGGSISTAGAITATGAITSGSLSTGGAITATGAITGGSITTAAGSLTTNTGNIGIGTTAPVTRFQLDDGLNTGPYASAIISRPLNSHTGSHMAFIRSGAQVMGVGYAPSLNTFGFGPGASGVAFNPSYLSIDQNTAQVKIGATAATGLLNVGGYASTASWLSSFQTTGAVLTDGVNAVQNVSIKADGAILAAVYLVSSDRRIKTKLSPTDPVKDLKTLMGIEVTDYQLKDTVANGSAQHKMVIAQQVEEVYPQAVSRQKGVVPDIYQKASVKEGWVQLATDLKVGERVRFMLPSGDSVEDVLEVRSDSFRTSLKTPADELVVYGREVSDFRTVDYTAIAMLNVSATQQLKHEKDAEMQVLRDENAALRRELATKERELAAKDESVEARLIALERRISGEGEAQTVSLKTASAAK